jgi:hypothetical protein
MPRYAEWIEYTRGGKSQRTLISATKQSRRIYDENSTCYLVHDQEGPIWVPKNSVRVVEKEE